MPMSAVLGFALVALTLIAVPGPDWAYIVAAGARDQVVAPAVAGLMAGYAAITAIVAAGVGPVVARSPLLLLALTVGGAACLICLGIKALCSPAYGAVAGGDAPLGRSRSHYLLRGAGVSALNPKGLLIFMSILPQFARPALGWPMPMQLATLGGIFTLTCGLFYLFLGYTFGRMLDARPVVARATTKVAGVAMVAISFALLAERLLRLG